MTNGMSLEVQVANSARVWRESSHGADIAANEFRDRKFAEPYASRKADQEWSFQFVRSG